MIINILFYAKYHNPRQPSIEGVFILQNQKKIESALAPRDCLFSKINKLGRVIVSRDLQLLLLTTYGTIHVFISNCFYFCHMVEYIFLYIFENTYF